MGMGSTRIAQCIWTPAQNRTICERFCFRVGWFTGTLTAPLIGQVIWQNQPNGISSFGTTAVPIVDPLLGPQTVHYVKPSPLVLSIAMTIDVRQGFDFPTVAANVKTALAAASTAVTPPGSNAAPKGQLGPGQPVISTQLMAVVMGVPGLFDIEAFAIGFSPATPTAVRSLPVDLTQIATLAASNITVSQGVGP